MNYVEFEKKAIEYHKILNDFLGYDIEKEQSGFEKNGKILLTDYDIKKSILEFNNFISVGKYEQALSSFDNNLNNFIIIGVRTKADILSKKHLELSKYYEIVRGILELNSSYMGDGFSTYINKFRSLSFFTDEELESKDLDHEVQVYIERAINKKLFKNYLYFNGEDKLDPNDAIIFYPKIGISEDIEGWLGFLKKQTDFVVSRPNTIIATLFLKLDDIEPHFSSFLITLHKGNSIWICTDRLEFGNPHNKEAQSARGNMTGKIGRDKEEHYNNIGLPYHLAWNMENIRSNQLVKSNYYQKIDLNDKAKEIIDRKYWDNKKLKINHCLFNELVEIELQKLGYKFNSNKILSTDSFNNITGIVYKYNGRKIAYFQTKIGILTIYNKPEINVFDISELDVLEKFYYVNLVDRLLEEIFNNPPQSRLELASVYLDKKMIGEYIFDPKDVGSFYRYSDVIQSEVEELLIGANIHETGLLPLKYDIVLNTPNYDSGYLATSDKLENYIRWNVLDDNRNFLQGKLNDLTINKKEDFITLEKLLNIRKDEVYKWVFLGNNTFIERNKPTSSFNSETRENKISVLMVKCAPNEYKTSWGHFNIGKVKYDKELCYECRNFNSWLQYRISIRHYKDLMLILGLTDRNDLPPYYRNYKSHENIQYRGNSTLDNVHPYSRLYDPCSNDNTNGIFIDVFMCNKCAKKYLKEYHKFDKVIIGEDLSLREFEGSESYYSYI